MVDFLRQLFVSDFMPHGHCFFWKPEILWSHVFADSTIAIAYYSIPATLIYFVRRRTDLAFNWMFVMFGIFIFACGTTHLIEIWTLWTPVYRFEAVVKVMTALVSIGTAVALVQLVPKALALPSPAELERANSALRNEVEERTRVQEALAARNRDLDEFARIASHDLREPLRKIQAFSERLAQSSKDGLGSQGLDYLGRITGASERMSGLIGDLLDYSRASSTSPNFQGVDLAEVIRGVLTTLEVAIEEVGGRVEVGELPTVRADSTQMHQLFQNLVSNSLKYHRRGVPPIVRIRGEESDGGWRVTLEDNGIGFEPEQSEQIFAPFVRLHGRGEYEGTGIGLAVCRKIVERHGGQISAMGRPGEGSTFLVDFPGR